MFRKRGVGELGLAWMELRCFFVLGGFRFIGVFFRIRWRLGGKG